MKLIKSIDIIEIDRDWAEIYKTDFFYPNSPPIFSTDGEYVPSEILKEFIQGQRIFLQNGDEIVLGVSEDVSELLWVADKSFTDMQGEIKTLKSSVSTLRGYKRYLENDNQQILKENEELENELNSYKAMKLWDRIKFLFKGEKYGS